ncbi:MAG: hypothetical protein KAI24_05495 [Planctomycetes bacterium]|nr:hypothetical protein [Planctomycetota bacterium]
MIRKHLFPFLVAASFAFAGCSSDESVGPDQPNTPSEQQVEEPPPPPLPETLVISEPTVHAVKCGCSIDGVRRCGNYIEIAGRYVPIVHPKLGMMEWCSKQDAGAKIETTGELQDGKFVATAWKTVE